MCSRFRKVIPDCRLTPYVYGPGVIERYAKVDPLQENVCLTMNQPPPYFSPIRTVDGPFNMIYLRYGPLIDLRAAIEYQVSFWRLIKQYLGVMKSQIYNLPAIPAIPAIRHTQVDRTWLSVYPERDT